MKYYLNYFFEKIKQRINPLLIPLFLLIFCFVIFPLFLLVFISFSNVDNLKQEFTKIDNTFWDSILKSLFVAICTTVISIIFAYPLVYILVFEVRAKYRKIIFLLLSAPIWSNFLIKLIGLKCTLDFLLGAENMTYGIGYTILGMTHLYYLFAAITLYDSMKTVPKNIYNASIDIGYSKWETFWKVIIPNTKKGLLSAIILVLLPSFTSVGVSKFLDQGNSNLLLGDYIYYLANNALNNDVDRNKSATLALIISGTILLSYLTTKIIKYFYIKHKRKLSCSM